MKDDVDADMWRENSLGQIASGDQIAYIVKLILITDIIEFLKKFITKKELTW